MLGIKYPIILAPMFLVSNTKMIIAAAKSGITGCIPALNYRSTADLRKAIHEIKSNTQGSFGINLIANKSNIKLKEQLQVCLEEKVDFVITSLGNPQSIIEQCHNKGIKVFCDVVDEKYGSKVASSNPDGLIAVNSQAGGHAGKLSSKELLNRLRSITDLPLISAGGVGQGSQIVAKLSEGACGVSMGSPFIASVESDVSNGYKQACIDYSSKDIVMTTKLSGTPCTVINTPYVQTIGTDQNFVEAFLNKNKRFKKLAKSLTFYRGMKSLQKAAFSSTYKTVWCAGPSIDFVHEVLPVQQIVDTLVEEMKQSHSVNTEEQPNA